MKRAPHTSTTPGKRVRVTLRDGSPAIEGRFVECRSREIIVEEEEGLCRRGAVVLHRWAIQKRAIKQFIVNPRPA